MYILQPDDFKKFDTEKATKFVEFWEEHYDKSETSEEKKLTYENGLNIGGQLTEQNVIDLLRWKDPRLLNHPKKDNTCNKHVKRVLKKLKDLNKFRNGTLCKDKFKIITGEIFQSGHVYGIFLFHICKPIEYPIIDQHVKRAFNYHKEKTHFKNNPTLEQAWDHYKEYRNYFSTIYNAMSNKTKLDNNIESVKALKRVDNALMAFGQFLGKYE